MVDRRRGLRPGALAPPTRALCLGGRCLLAAVLLDLSGTPLSLSSQGRGIRGDHRPSSSPRPPTQPPDETHPCTLSPSPLTSTFHLLTVPTLEAGPSLPTLSSWAPEASPPPAVSLSCSLPGSPEGQGPSGLASTSTPAPLLPSLPSLWCQGVSVSAHLILPSNQRPHWAGWPITPRPWAHPAPPPLSDTFPLPGTEP